MGSRYTLHDYQAANVRIGEIWTRLEAKLAEQQQAAASHGLIRTSLAADECRTLAHELHGLLLEVSVAAEQLVSARAAA